MESLQGISVTFESVDELILSGRDHLNHASNFFGSGTSLDTARFQYLQNNIWTSCWILTVVTFGEKHFKQTGLGNFFFFLALLKIQRRLEFDLVLLINTCYVLILNQPRGLL